MTSHSFKTFWGPAPDIAEFLIRPDVRSLSGGENTLRPETSYNQALKTAEEVPTEGGALVTYRGLAGS
jgi:hypothetical protein